MKIVVFPQEMFLNLYMFAGGPDFNLPNKQKFKLTGKDFVEFFFGELETVAPHFFNDVTTEQKDIVRVAFTNALSKINHQKNSRGTVQETIPVEGEDEKDLFGSMWLIIYFF